MPKKSSTTSFSKGCKGSKQWTTSNLEDVRRLAAEREHSSNKDTSNGYIHNVKFLLDDPRYSVLQKKFSFEEVRDKISRYILVFRKTAAFKERTSELSRLTNQPTRCYALEPNVLLSNGSAPLTSILVIASTIQVNHEIVLNGVDSVKTKISESNHGAVALSTTTYIVMLSPKGGPNSPAIVQDQVLFLDRSIVSFTYDPLATDNIRMVVVKEDKDFLLRPVVEIVTR